VPVPGHIVLDGNPQTTEGKRREGKGLFLKYVIEQITRVKRWLSVAFSIYE